MERRADTRGWAGAGDKGAAAPTCPGQKSQEAMISPPGCSALAISKSRDSVSLCPNVVTQKIPKNHPMFFTSGI